MNEAISSVILPVIQKAASSFMKNGVMPFLRSKADKRRFINEIVPSHLHSEQWEGLREPLRKWLEEKDHLEAIWQRCYQRDLDDNKTDEEFVEDIIGSERWRDEAERESAKEFVYLLVKDTFEVFNKLRDENSRRLCNWMIKIASQGIARSKEEIMPQLGQRMQQIQTPAPLNISAGVVLQDLLHNKDYVLNVRAKNSEQAFRYVVWVKETEELARFRDEKQLLGYLNFTGKPMALTVARMQCFNQEGKLLQNFEAKNIPKMMKLGQFYSSVYSWDQDLMQNEGAFQMIISPMANVLEMDICDGAGNPILLRLKQRITREVLSNGNLQLTLNGVDGGGKMEVIITCELMESSSGKVTFRFINKKPQDVYANLIYFKLLKKIHLADALVCYQSATGEEICRSEHFSDLPPLSEIEYNIAFYQSIQKVQKHFSIQFDLPNEYEIEDVNWLEKVAILLRDGIAIIKGIKLPNVFQGVDVERMQSYQDLIKEGNKCLFSAVLNPIRIWNAQIDFGDDLILILPKAHGELNEAGQIEIVPDTVGLLVLQSKFPEDDCHSIAQKYLRGELTVREEIA